MTPVKSIRPATEYDQARCGSRQPSKYVRPAKQIAMLLNEGKSVVVEIRLEEGETELAFRQGLANALKRGGAEVKVHKLEPEEGRPENEVDFLIGQRERK